MERVYKHYYFIIRGEILGITGLLGSGRTELMQAIFGYNPADSGDIYLNGKKTDIKSVSDGIKNGIGYIPPERSLQGLFMDQSISDNISVTGWNKMKDKFGFLDEEKIKRDVSRWIDELSIKVNDINDNMRTLSGGNAQKCVLAKWLSLDLKVLILNGPTVGVDIGAKFDIYRLIKELSKNGLSVIIISDDIREVMMNCNRVIIMKKGRLTKELYTNQITEQELADMSIED